MSDLRINGKNVTSLLRKSHGKLKGKWMLLLEVPIESVMEVNIEAVRILQEKGYEGIYITFSKDYPELSELFRKEGIDLSKIKFIDGISGMYNILKSKKKNVSYISGPLALEEMGEAIKTLSKEMKTKKGFVFLDSITTILLYNSVDKTLEFSQFFAELLEEEALTGVMASVSKAFADKQVSKALGTLADEVISL